MARYLFFSQHLPVFLSVCLLLLVVSLPASASEPLQPTTACLLLLPLSQSLPLQSTTVHRVDSEGRVKSHGGFLGGYPFKVSGLTRSFALPDFVLRPGGVPREVVEEVESTEEQDDNSAAMDLDSFDLETGSDVGQFPYNLAS